MLDPPLPASVSSTLPSHDSLCWGAMFSLRCDGGGDRSGEICDSCE